MSKRRIVIFGGMIALYAVLMTVTWVVSTSQAEESTDAQLDFSVLNLHDTVAGAIDTMLGHVARTAVRHIGSARVMPMSSMAASAIPRRRMPSSTRSSVPLFFSMISWVIRIMLRCTAASSIITDFSSIILNSLKKSTEGRDTLGL